MNDQNITDYALIIAAPFVNIYNGVLNTGKPALMCFVLFMVIAIVDSFTGRLFHYFFNFFGSVSFWFAGFFAIAGLLDFDLKPINLFDTDETVEKNETEE